MPIKDIATKFLRQPTNDTMGGDETQLVGEQEPDEAVTPEESCGAAGETDLPEAHGGEDDDKPPRATRGIRWPTLLVFGVLPAVALALTVAAGFFKWQDQSSRAAGVARVESIEAAKDSTVAILSYQPDKVEQQLGGARTLLTGQFRDAYTKLTNDVVIPGAKQKRISAVATVPAVASVSANAQHAVAVVFVNQTVIVGNDAPADTTSSVRVTLDKIGGHWLVSGFDPV